MKKVDVIVIGGGSAGITAYKEAKKKAGSVLLINEGEDGTTCARVGCMPSKSFIQIAQDFSRTKTFSERGIQNSEQLKINFPQLMQHVRCLRDHFVSGILKEIKLMGSDYIKGKVKIISLNKVEVNGEIFEPNRIVIATGSRPSIPNAWKDYSEFFMTSDDFFELTEAPKSLAIIGLGALGLEIGLALSQLGVKVTGFCKNEFIGGLSDPQVNEIAKEIISKDFPFTLHKNLNVTRKENQFIIQSNNKEYTFEKILISAGRTPNIDHLGLAQLCLPLDDTGIPLFDPHTMQIKGTSLFLAGDITSEKAVLPNAIDEGFIAGYNASHEKSQAFKKRCDIFITFTDPTICVVGRKFSSLQNENYISGQSSFETQGRAVIMGRAQGIIKIYGEPETGKIIGAEMICPEGEHLAHLLAFCIQQQLTVTEALKLPFYHPVIEESLVTAFKDMQSKIKNEMKQSRTRLDFMEDKKNDGSTKIKHSSTYGGLTAKTYLRVQGIY